MFDPVFIKVLLGTLLLAASSSVVGAFSFLKGESLVGDAIAHALLPGVVLAFILGDGRNPFALIFGALLAGLTAHYGISYLEQRTKLKGDTAISLVLSTFFGFGIMLLSAVQRTGHGQQAGLERFLLGKAAAITLSDLYVFAALALVLLASVALFFKGFQLMTFNEDFAAAIGTPILATASGTVTESARRGGNGNYVKIRHNSTYSTQYLHMSKRMVKVGDYVSQGDVIGKVGMTGNTSGPHVCYRFWKNGRQVDPFRQKLPDAKALSKTYKPDFLSYIAPLKERLDLIN